MNDSKPNVHAVRFIFREISAMSRRYQWSAVSRLQTLNNKNPHWTLFEQYNIRFRALFPPINLAIMHSRNVIFNHITVSLPHARTCYNRSFIYFILSGSETQNRRCTRAIDAEKLEFKTVHNLPNRQYNMPYSWVSFHTSQPKHKFYFEKPMNTALRLT